MPDTEISRAETGERARLLHGRSCDVDLDFTRGRETFGSACLIRFDCREPGSITRADLIATGILEITLNGVRLDPTLASPESSRTTATQPHGRFARGSWNPVPGRRTVMHHRAIRRQEIRIMSARFVLRQGGRSDQLSACHGSSWYWRRSR
jgi:hypothetical protein